MTRLPNVSRGWLACGAVLLLAAASYEFHLGLAGSADYQQTVTEENAVADLKLHRDALRRVGAGEHYYTLYNEGLRQYHFPVGSIFNWRLPTYAVVLGRLPTLLWVQVLLTAIGTAGMVLAALVVSREEGVAAGGCVGVLQYGLVHWCFDGDAYLSPEVWAALLILLSVGLAGMGWRWPAFAVGLSALFFRELALPYCVAAGFVTWWYGRRGEALAWALGIAAFFVFLAWHARQVSLQLSPEDRAGSQGFREWITFGGLAFDVMTTRMNAFLANAPGWLVALYLAAAVLGLVGWRGELGETALLTVLMYLAGFSMVGMTKNIYWGLLPAPFLPFGVVRAPAVLRELVHALRSGPSAPDPSAGPTH